MGDVAGVGGRGAARGVGNAAVTGGNAKRAGNCVALKRGIGDKKGARAAA